MRAEATEGAVMSPGYTFGLLCECCGARRSDGSLRWCLACQSSGTETATSPWWQEPDGVLARVRGDAAVVREIISLKGLACSTP